MRLLLSGRSRHLAHKVLPFSGSLLPVVLPAGNSEIVRDAKTLKKLARPRGVEPLTPRSVGSTLPSSKTGLVSQMTREQLRKAHKSVRELAAAPRR
jgi:hypothetical protein